MVCLSCELSPQPSLRGGLMLPGAAGLQSGAVLGEQTHWGIMKDLLSFLQHPMGLLTASWWLCPPSAPGSLVARWCGQYLGIRCHRALLSSNILQCCKRGDGTKWSRAGMGTPCGRPPLDGKLRPARSVHLCPARARAARVGGGLRVWGCPERAALCLCPSSRAGQFLLHGAGKTNASQVCPQSLAWPQMKNSSLSRCSVLPLLLP